MDNQANRGRDMKRVSSEESKHTHISVHVWSGQVPTFQCLQFFIVILQHISMMVHVHTKLCCVIIL